MLGFVSFDLRHDEAALVKLKAELPAWQKPLDLANWSLQEPPTGPEWKKLRRDRISRSDLMVVLVGNDVATAANVLEDIQFAKGSNVPFFGIYLDGADSGSPPPAGLAKNRIVSWDATRVSAALDQMMNEGKHHKFK